MKRLLIILLLLPFLSFGQGGSYFKLTKTDSLILNYLSGTGARGILIDSNGAVYVDNDRIALSDSGTYYVTPDDIRLYIQQSDSTVLYATPFQLSAYVELGDSDIVYVTPDSLRLYIDQADSTLLYATPHQLTDYVQYDDSTDGYVTPYDNRYSVQAEQTTGENGDLLIGVSGNKFRLGRDLDSVIRYASAPVFSESNQLVSKSYVDSKLNFDTLKYKNYGINITNGFSEVEDTFDFSGIEIIDGITTTTGDKILITASSGIDDDGVSIGVWVANDAGAWTRANYADSYDELINSWWIVFGGYSYFSSQWYVTYIDTLEYGSAPGQMIPYIESAGYGYYNSSNGISINNNIISANYNNTNIGVSAGQLTVIAGSIDDTELGNNIDVAQFADGSVSDTEFQYLDGVTSDIQTQFGAKADTLNNVVMSDTVSIIATKYDLLTESFDTTQITGLADFVANNETDPYWIADSSQVQTDIRNIEDSLTNIYTQGQVNTLLGAKADTLNNVVMSDTASIIATKYDLLSDSFDTIQVTGLADFVANNETDPYWIADSSQVQTDIRNLKDSLTNIYTEGQVNTLLGNKLNSSLYSTSAYNSSSWNGSANVGTQDAIRDKLVADSLLWKSAVSSDIDVSVNYSSTTVNTILEMDDISGVDASISFEIDPASTYSAGVMTTALYNRLVGIETGAEVNEQANWTESNSALDSYILNKPNVIVKSDTIRTATEPITTKYYVDSLHATVSDILGGLWTENGDTATYEGNISIGKDSTVSSNEGEIVYYSDNAVLKKSTNYGVDFSTVSGATPTVIKTDETGDIIIINTYASPFAAQLKLSIDGGDTWSNKGEDSMQFISASDDLQYIISTKDYNVNSYDYPQLSRDYGQTWEEITDIPLPTTKLLPCISRNGKYMSMFSYIDDTLRYSSDYGVTWTERYMGAMAQYSNVMAISDNGEMLFLSYAATCNLYYYSSFAATGSSIKTHASSDASAMIFYPEMVLSATPDFSEIVYCQKSYLYYSTNKTTFRVIYNPTPDIRMAKIASSGNYILCLSDSLRSSTDNGSTWTTRSLPSSSTIYGFDISNEPSSIGYPLDFYQNGSEYTIGQNSEVSLRITNDGYIQLSEGEYVNNITSDPYLSVVGTTTLPTVEAVKSYIDRAVTEVTETEAGINTITFSSSDLTTTGSPITAPSGTITLNLLSDAVDYDDLNDNIIIGQPALTSGLLSSDELLISDGGIIKRMDVEVLSDYIQSDIGASLGDITSVTAGNGLTGGGTEDGVTITLGTPTTISEGTLNVSSTTSHNHAFDMSSFEIEDLGDIAAPTLNTFLKCTGTSPSAYTWTAIDLSIEKLVVQDDGADDISVDSINFVGATVTDEGTGKVTVTFSGASGFESFQTLTCASSITWSWYTYNAAELTMSSNVTSLTFTNQDNGEQGELWVFPDATTDYTLTFGDATNYYANGHDASFNILAGSDLMYVFTIKHNGTYNRIDYALYEKP